MAQAGQPVVLPLDGEGGPKQSFGSEGVKPGAGVFTHLAPTPSTPPLARSPFPVKGKDGGLL